MMRRKILKTCLLILILIYWHNPMVNAKAGDSCNNKVNIATNTGNRKYADDWQSSCECNGGDPVIHLSSDIVMRDNFIEVWVDSVGEACPTYTWSISGSGFHFDNISGPSSATTESDSEKLQLWADDTACGAVFITVTDTCGEKVTASAREPNNGHWVLIEDITCGTVDSQPGAGNCHSDYYCTEGGYRYLDSWVAGTNMGSRWHPTGNCTKYACTPYTANYCYDPGYYPKMYHVGIQYKKKWRWACP